MSMEQNESNQPNQDMKAYVEQRMEWIGDANEAAGSHRDSDPLVIFPEAAVVRSDGTALVLGRELKYYEEAAVRAVGNKFEIGNLGDHPSEAPVQLNDGGKVWKVASEALLTEGAEHIIFSGMPDRRLDAEELEHMRTIMGVETDQGMNEYQMIGHVAMSLEGFVELVEPEALDFGYELVDGEVRFVPDAADGQLTKIGTAYDGTADVYTLRLDKGGPYVDPAGEAKNFKRANTDEQIRFIGAALAANGVEITTVGFNSSNTYPSRVLGALVAAVKSGIDVRPGYYGRETLAKVRLQEVADQPELKHLIGEFHNYYAHLLELKSIISEGNNE